MRGCVGRRGPHLQEPGGRLRARRRRHDGRGEEEGGGVEGGDRVEAREREELGLTVAAFDLALHGGAPRPGARPSG
jgi:hypothetical protein